MSGLTENWEQLWVKNIPESYVDLHSWEATANPPINVSATGW